MSYRLLFRVVLRRLEPEAAHRMASRSLRAVTAIPGAAAMIRRRAGSRDPRLEVRALGRTFPSPLGAAAGLDKDGSWVGSLAALGFGHVEVGTVTVQTQEGNPRPRVFRLMEDRALLNRMGFPNPGAGVVAERLRRRRGPAVVGANVGKSMAVPMEQAAADYRAAVRELGPVADYLVVNVSSPNTPGLRGLQEVEGLRALLGEVREELDEVGARVPLLVKIGPDLGDDQLDAIADLATDLGLDGIVAVNTTVDRRWLGASTEEAAALEGGGISGAPLKARALQVLRRLYARAGRDLVLISVGGIETPEDACERILAGATLIQAYTGFIYGGPGWPRRINRGLSRRVREVGAASIEELVGAGAGVPSEATRVA